MSHGGFLWQDEYGDDLVCLFVGQPVITAHSSLEGVDGLVPMHVVAGLQSIVASINSYDVSGSIETARMERPKECPISPALSDHVHKSYINQEN